MEFPIRDPIALSTPVEEGGTSHLPICTIRYEASRGPLQEYRNVISNETWQRVWWSAALIVLGLVSLVLSFVYSLSLDKPVISYLFAAISVSSCGVGGWCFTRISAER